MIIDAIAKGISEDGTTTESGQRIVHGRHVKFPSEREEEVAIVSERYSTGDLAGSVENVRRWVAGCSGPLMYMRLSIGS